VQSGEGWHTVARIRVGRLSVGREVGPAFGPYSKATRGNIDLTLTIV
jgi:hypothetical protein